MRRPAFTFLELLLALSLFVIGMISVLQIFPVNRRLISQSANATQASFLGQEQIEKIRNTSYTDLPAGNYEPRAAVSTTSGDPFTIFERETVVTLIDSNRQTTVTDVGLKKIVVTVYWQERNVNRTYVLTTYAYRK